MTNTTLRSTSKARTAQAVCWRSPCWRPSSARAPDPSERLSGSRSNTPMICAMRCIAWARGEQFAGLLLVTACLCGGSCLGSLAGLPILAGRIGERHPARRGGAAWGVAAGAVSPDRDQVRRRVARDRFGTRPRAGGTQRADGRERRRSRGPHVPAQLAGLSSTACRRCRRRTGHGFQRTDRRRHFCAGGIGAAVRGAHRHCRARRIGDRHCGGTRVPR